MGYAAYDVLGCGGEGGQPDALCASCEEGGDPLEGVLLYSYVVQSVNEGVVRDGVKCRREVEEDQGRCFSVVEDSSEVICGSNQCGLSAVVGTES